ncbi:MAG: glucosyl transferase [Ignavibacteria bacterium]|nr:glucosyl transferase [Ignavibacteria bacterium]
MKPHKSVFLFPSSFFHLVIAFLMLLNLGCKKAPTEPNTTATLSVEDISCTEAWVKITTANYQTPNTLTLFVNDKADQNITLVSSDTLLYIDSLLPNQSYKIKAAFAANNQLQTTNEVIAKTMDTTSHNFTWQTFAFGEQGSSTLYDVAIIDENNIWAVGEIYMNDSLGKPDPNAYNAAHWDGQKWELKRIYTFSSCNPVDYAPLKAIWAFSDTNIVVTSGGSIGWYNGKTNKPDCSIRSLLTGAINKMWGTSSSDLYAVGNGGNIAHYDGKSWQKIESGTTLNINDIWGDFNQRTQKWEILTVASNFLTGLEKEILQIINNIVTKIPTSAQMWPLKTVWFVPNKQYYVAGSGIYQKRSLTDYLWKNEALDITTFSTYSLRGNDVNDVIGVGAYGDVVHFNGVSWKNDYTDPVFNNQPYLASVSIKNNLVVTVGIENRQAVLIKGKR